MTGFAVLSYFVLVYLIFFLTYTPVASPHVLGVQGRYFVIALPMAAIFMASLINLELPRGVPALVAITGSMIAGVTSVDAVLKAHWWCGDLERPLSRLRRQWTGHLTTYGKGRYDLAFSIKSQAAKRNIGTWDTFSVKAYYADRPLTVTAETAKEAFAKAVEWHLVERFTNVSISDGIESYSIDGFASAIALEEIANTVEAAAELGTKAKVNSASGPPSHYERSALTELASGRELPLSQLFPAGRHTIAKKLGKGWIERAGSTQLYRITEEGKAAFPVAQCGLRDQRKPAAPVVAVPGEQPHPFPSRWMIRRYPSCLISCSQSFPGGTTAPRVGMQGS
jgi:hypothetical protein